MLITLYKIGELHFRSLGTNGFHVKAKSEIFTAASSHCRQSLKYENFTQPRSQGLSFLPPLVVGTENLVAAGHLTTQNLGGRKLCWKGGATGFFIATVTNLLSTKCT